MQKVPQPWPRRPRQLRRPWGPASFLPPNVSTNFCKDHKLAENLKFYSCIFKILPDEEFMTISSVISCLIDNKAANFDQIHKFWSCRISKIPMVNFWMDTFSYYLFKFCFLLTQI